MKSARHPILRRLAPVLPTFVIMVTATVGVVAAGPEPATTRVETVSYANGNPIGKLEHLTHVKGGLRAIGYTFDPSSAKRKIRVYPRVSGHRGKSVVAKKKRAVVKRKYPAAGSRHGFNFFIPVPEGRRTVCVYAKDIKRGKDTRLGCKRHARFYYGPYTTPGPQTTPAPISTSRYIRNIATGSICTDAEAATMSASGQFDAQHNPSGHRYLQLLDIGGQRQGYGVVLSATTRRVPYAGLLACMKSYVSGYVSGMLPMAPATIAIGVNNDIDVNVTTGQEWATQVINPLVSFAAGFPGVRIAGANDIEPGFRASFAATNSWLAGYLGATSAPFIFNGSADGCSGTTVGRSCNNGWTMARLYQLAAGAAPTRMINLPQVYNYTMADQWKYISLTGIAQGMPRINFGGPLTEYTACAQARSCASIGGVAAWQRMWNNLQSHPALQVTTLPYSTDLRIDN